MCIYIYVCVCVCECVSLFWYMLCLYAKCQSYNFITKVADKDMNICINFTVLELGHKYTIRVTIA